MYKLQMLNKLWTESLINSIINSRGKMEVIMYLIITGSLVKHHQITQLSLLHALRRNFRIKNVKLYDS